MAVSLLGVMAVAMFYLLTIVMGLCANRCLNRENEVPVDVPKIKREKSTETELMKLAQGGGGGTSKNRSTVDVDGNAVSPKNHLVTASWMKRNGGTDVLPTYVRGPPITTPSMDRTPTADSSPSGLLEDKIEASPLENSRVEYHFPTGADDGEMISRVSVDSEFTIAPRLPLPIGHKYLIAERNIGFVIGSFSILVIKTGGFYSSAISEEVFTQGLLWCHLPVATCASLLIAGALFAGQMQAEGYVTIIDPFQEVYGRRVGVLLSIPVMLAELIAAAAVISSLGILLEKVLEISQDIAVFVSLGCVVCYLMVGGLYAVTFTDVMQFIYLCFGLFMFFPFTLANCTKSLSNSLPDWLGTVDANHVGVFIDQFSMLVLGGIPFQSYFQRVLSCRSSNGPRFITLVGSIGCLINAVPAILIGAAAKSTDWSNYTTEDNGLTHERTSLVLHYSLTHLVPSGIAFLIVGALASGILAAADSSIFAGAAIFAHNVYAGWIRPNTEERELLWICRLTILLYCLVILGLCLARVHVYHAWLTAFDILYVIVFPQLFCVLYFRYSNTYGAISGTFCGSVLRILLGDPRLGIPVTLSLPFYTTSSGQLFPYRTLAMVVNFLVTIIVSLFYHWLYKRGTLTSANDVFMCFSAKSRRSHRRKRDKGDKLTPHPNYAPPIVNPASVPTLQRSPGIIPMTSYVLGSAAERITVV